MEQRWFSFYYNKYWPIVWRIIFVSDLDFTKFRLITCFARFNFWIRQNGKPEDTISRWFWSVHHNSNLAVWYGTNHSIKGHVCLLERKRWQNLANSSNTLIFLHNIFPFCYPILAHFNIYTPFISNYGWMAMLRQCIYNLVWVLHDNS